MKNNKVFILILNYNGAKNTLRCLESIDKLLYKNYEVVIVDNNSTDNSEKILRQNAKNCTILQTGNNTGYAGGNNFGIKYCLEKQAEYILILNNDIICDEDFLGELLKPFDKIDNLAISAPKVLYYDRPNIINTYGSRKDVIGRIVNIGNGDADSDKYTKPIYVKYVMGCCILIKSQVLKEVGLFDERFFMYIEESDLCERINKKYKLFINPNSKVYHDESSSTKKTNGINYFAKYYIRRNQLLFSMKNYNFKNKFILRFSLFLKDIIYSILHINDKKYRYIIFHAWLDYILKNFYRNEKVEGVINS